MRVNGIELSSWLVNKLFTQSFNKKDYPKYAQKLIRIMSCTNCSHSLECQAY
jgi:hypothetical protein